MKIGVLGGTFDPVHLGHLLIAELAWEGLGLEQVLFVPAGDPPHKQGAAITSGRHRRAMVELAIADRPQFVLCPLDLERPGPHYSVETVRLVRKEHNLGPDDCFFIIGSDSLADLPEWHQPEVLITLCRLAVVHRPGYRPELADLESQIPGLRARVSWVAMPEIGIAASDIRARVAAGQSIRYQVMEGVREYIEEHGLFSVTVPT